MAIQCRNKAGTLQIADHHQFNPLANRIFALNFESKYRVISNQF